MTGPIAVVLVSLVHMAPAPPVPRPQVMVARNVEEPELVFERLLGPADEAELDAMMAEAGGLPVRHGPYHIYFATLDADDDLHPAVISQAPPAATHVCPMLMTAASLEPLMRWLLVLLALGLVATILGSVGASRRPLPIAASAVRQPARPISLVERLLVLVCLWSPLLMLLGLLQVQHGLLSTVLLASAGVGAGACAMMLSARRRLLARLRWALGGRLDRVSDGSLVSVEVDARKLVAPHGVRGAVPWYRADLCVAVPGDAPQPARVALDDALVDDDAARVLLKVALGKSTTTRLTVVGHATRGPADPSSARALERHASVQPRLAGGAYGRALIVAGTPADLARRVRIEGALLVGALGASAAAALLTMLS
jgi:hypothetical protein